jgi:hypothetical protein
MSTTECEPIVCTLSAEKQATRAAEFRAAFKQLVATETFKGGFRWTFTPKQGLCERLASLAEREHDCCRFFEFRVFSTADAVVWETRASADAAPVMEEFMRLPASLSTDSADSLKRALGKAGLEFASDD